MHEASYYTSKDPKKFEPIFAKNSQEIAVLAKKPHFWAIFFNFLGPLGGLGGPDRSDIAREGCNMYLKGPCQVSFGSVIFTELDP